jgi:hypothetical protein
MTSSHHHQLAGFFSKLISESPCISNFTYFLCVEFSDFYVNQFRWKNYIKKNQMHAYEMTNVNSTPPTQLPHTFSYIVAIILILNHFESPNSTKYANDHLFRTNWFKSLIYNISKVNYDVMLLRQASFFQL